MSALIAIFATSFVVGLSGALMPGPLFTLTVRESLRLGFWAGPALALGHILIELLLVIALALGLSRLLNEESPAMAIIAIVGGLFLLWMGYRILRTVSTSHLDLGEQEAGKVSNSSNRPEPDATPPAAGGTTAWNLAPMASSLVPAGAMISIANPYWIIWWASIGTAYVSESLNEGAAGVVSFFSAHALSDIGWLALVAFVLATGRRLMSQTIYRGILVLCSLFLLALAAWFIYSGVDFFL